MEESPHVMNCSLIAWVPLLVTFHGRRITYKAILNASCVRSPVTKEKSPARTEQKHLAWQRGLALAGGSALRGLSRSSLSPLKIWRGHQGENTVFFQPGKAVFRQGNVSVYVRASF